MASLRCLREGGVEGVSGDECRVALLGVVGVPCVRLSCGDVMMRSLAHLMLAHGYGFAGCQKRRLLSGVKAVEELRLFHHEADTCTEALS